VGDLSEDHIWFNTSEPLSLYDEYRGHIVVLLFGRFESLSAVQDLSALRRLAEEYQDSPLGIAVVYRTETTDLDSLHATMRSWSLEFPVVVDDDGDVSANFGISAYPAVIVLGTHKRVSARFYAGWQEANLQGIVADLIGEGTASHNLSREPFRPDGGEYVPPRLRDI
jgi:peroxiredoxin